MSSLEVCVSPIYEGAAFGSGVISFNWGVYVGGKLQHNGQEKQSPTVNSCSETGQW